ncbi:MAG: DUF4174 domain-containing protein [Roseinatronobacter sp.]
MKPILTLVFALVFPLGAVAQTVGPQGTAMAQGAVATDATSQALPEGLQVLDAREINVRDFIWSSRIIVVMADTPDDPVFTRQIEALRAAESEMILRDVVVVIDAHPANRSPLRQVLRPRGFMSAIIDKDGEVKARRPAFRTAREWVAVIDRFPTRRQEMLEQLPSGR